jgi:methylated-DNA-[protein]-cysteine S-methyltransferase
VIRWTTLDSPLGTLTVARDERGLTALLLPAGRQSAAARWVRDPAGFDDLRDQLADYFAGTRTAFQQRVWQALREVPYGETTSYGSIARAIGAPVSASRAVGAANGQNPISIIVPCHRIIGASGALIGYGGGLPAKQWLLAHEAAHAGLFAC